VRARRFKPVPAGSDDPPKLAGNWEMRRKAEEATASRDTARGTSCCGSPARTFRSPFLPKAFVVLKDGIAPSPALVTALQDHVKHELAPYKYPREVEFVTALPRQETGKIRRVKLREREVQRKAPRSPGAV
jgi:acyl-CoA synthetase (AMP-forming)/AMP-acid ligase II